MDQGIYRRKIFLLELKAVPDPYIHKNIEYIV